MTLGKDGIKDIPKNLAVAGMLRLIKKVCGDVATKSRSKVNLRTVMLPLFNAGLRQK